MIVGVVTVLAAAGAHAQTTVKRPPAPAAPAQKKSFDKLSLGNQKVAAALYYAQGTTMPASGTNGPRGPSRALSLEQIATKRWNGQAWGQVFREMKAQGLVHERSLGQVVSRYQQALDATPGLLASDTTGRSNAPEIGSVSEGVAAHGVGKGSR